MNAYRAVKSDFVMPATPPPSFRSKGKAVEAALADPDQPVMLEQASDPRVRIGAGEFIDMHKAGIAVDIVAQGRPYDAIMELSEKLTELGASQRGTNALTDMIARIAEEGSSFSKKFNAKPLYARVVVSNEKPEIPERCQIVAVTQINASRILADDASNVTMQYTLYGTRMSMSRQMSVEEALGSHKKLDVWIIFGTLDEKDLNKMEQGGMSAADVTLATLVEATGVADGAALDEIKQAIENDAVSPEAITLLETLADIKNVLMESQTPGAIENAPLVLAGLQAKLEAMLPGGVERASLPPVLEKAVQTITMAAEGQMQAARVEAMIRPDMPTAPAAKNDNKAEGTAPVSTAEGKSVAVAAPTAIDGTAAPVSTVSPVAAMVDRIEAAFAKPEAASALAQPPIARDISMPVNTIAPIVPVITPVSITASMAAPVVSAPSTVSFAAPVVTALPASVSIAQPLAPVASVPAAKMPEPTFAVPPAKTESFIAEIKAGVPQTPAIIAIVEKIQAGAPLTQTDVSRIVADMGTGKDAVQWVNKNVVATPETVRALEIAQPPAPPKAFEPPVAPPPLPPAPPKDFVQPPQPPAPPTPLPGPEFKNPPAPPPTTGPEWKNPPVAPPSLAPLEPPKDFGPPIAPPVAPPPSPENFDKPPERPPAPPRDPEDRKLPERDPDRTPPREEPRRQPDRNPEDPNPYLFKDRDRENPIPTRDPVEKRDPINPFKRDDFGWKELPKDKIGGDKPKSKCDGCGGGKGCCDSFNEAGSAIDAELKIAKAAAKRDMAAQAPRMP